MQSGEIDAPARLAGVLQAARLALIEGKYGQLSELNARAERLLVAMPSATAAELAAIQAAASRNMRLVQAAQKGLRSGSDALARAQTGHAALEIYTDGGLRQKFETPVQSSDRRA